MKKKKVAVVGVGYVGSVVAKELYLAGFEVLGVDKDPKKGRFLQKQGINIKVQKNYSVVQECDVVLICVPTPLNQLAIPDLTFVTDSCVEIANNLKNGHLIILESTVPPGTTRSQVVPILESTGKIAGKDFYFAYSPERINPGCSDFSFKNTTKLVAGINEESSREALDFYSEICKPHLVESIEIAECAKLLENTYRNVNIALINELREFFYEIGVDSRKVVDAAATKPFGFQPFYPSPGVGGHCVPVNPLFLSWSAAKVNKRCKMIETAFEVHKKTPHYLVSKIVETFNEKGKIIFGSKIGIIGISYKKNISDIRNSPAISIMGILKKLGASVSYVDPYVPAVKIPSEIYFNGENSEDCCQLRSNIISKSYLSNLDACVICANHDIFSWEKISENCPLVFDFGGAFSQVFEKNVVKI